MGDDTRSEDFASVLFIGGPCSISCDCPPSTNAHPPSANDIDSPAPAREGGGSRICGPVMPQPAVFWEFAE